MRVLTIGDPKKPLARFPAAEITFAVEYESSHKVTDQAADGDDDATSIDGGREPRKLTLKMSWPDRADARKRAWEIVKKIDPSNRFIGEPGKPIAWSDAEEDGSFDFGAAKNVRFVTIKTAKGPNPDPASGVVKYELAMGSWSRQQKGAAKTVEPATYVDKGTGKVITGPATPTNANWGRTAAPAVKP